MALTRTWHSVVDIPLDDYNEATTSLLIAIKRCLVGDWSHGGVAGPNGAPPVPWTVEHSSNGLIYAPTDLWHSNSDILAASGNVNHSWISLRSPGGKLFSLAAMDRNASNATSKISWRNWVGLGAVTNINSLSPIVEPTSQYETGKTVTAYQGAFRAMIESPVSPTTRLCFTQSADGEYWLAILIDSALHPASVVRSAIGIWPVTPLAGLNTWETPWVLLRPAAQFTTGTTVLADTFQEWFSPTPPVELFYPNAAKTGGSGRLGIYALLALTTATRQNSAKLFSDGISGVNVYTDRYDELPIPVFTAEANHNHHLGTLEDLSFVHLNAQGSHVPESGPIERIVLSNMLIPFTKVPAL